MIPRSPVTTRCVGQQRFEWDPIKAGQKAHKHGVTFDEARTVFISARLLTRYERRLYEEEKFP